MASATEIARWQSIVEKAETWLETQFGDGEGVFSYVINGRQVQLRTIAEVEGLVQRYRARIAKATNGGGRSYVRFDA